MRQVQDIVQVDVRPTTSGSTDLIAFLWRGRWYVVTSRLGVWRSSPPRQVIHQQVATASGLIFDLHVEPSGTWVLDAVPDELATSPDGHDTAPRAG